ncbi:ACT domain-containing protein [Pseudooceanicola sp.]|jgi:hypothetical protein|uniref:ACT domain-containing protein n=1 Tax=Pseudooceanicola sp. TaxID=1914328 RepID=UPI004057DE8A
MDKPVKDSEAMIASMAPELAPGVWHFCACDARREAAFLPRALAAFREAEGLSLILDEVAARALGAPLDQPMRRITLTVHSALDGIGLTAAVSAELTAAGIPCNVVAALHHDHVFVPAAQAEAALAALRARAGQECSA